MLRACPFLFQLFTRLLLKLHFRGMLKEYRFTKSNT